MVPVLAAVIRVEHAHVDDAVDHDFDRLAGVGESRLWMLVLRASCADDGFIRHGGCADDGFDRQRLRSAKPGQPWANGIRHQIANGFAIPQQHVMPGDEEASPQGQRRRRLRLRYGLRLNDFHGWLLDDRRDQAIGGQPHRAAVQDATLDLQRGTRVHRRTGILLADAGEAFPQRRRQHQHREVVAQGPADGFGGVGGQGDHSPQARQCLAPVLTRIVVPVLGGNAVELPGDHAHHRALQVGGGLVRWRERNEQAVLTGLLQLPIQRVDLGGR
ncbi:hypothetical protein D3C75_606000 [compost metagenome]